MQNEIFSQQLRDALKISSSEPTTYLEFVDCLLAMKEDGVPATCQKIIKRLWPEDWDLAEDKVQFCTIKWDLLRKRRHKINERLLVSPLCFSFYIQLTPEKEFRILCAGEDIYQQRLEDYERSRSKARSAADQAKIDQEIALLRRRYGSASTVLVKRPVPFCWNKVLPFASFILFLLLIAASLYRLYPTFVDRHSFADNQLAVDDISIAVLPLVIKGSGDLNAVLGEGIIDGVISSLSRLPQMIVISRNSVFAYVNQSVDADLAARELGVRYLVDGNIQTVATQVRVSVRLHDATTGQLVWARRWDKQVGDLFNLQDEIVMSILAGLRMELSDGEKALALAKGTKNVEAYCRLIEAYHYFFQESLIDTLRARRLSEEAVAADPDYAAAYALMADCFLKEMEQKGEPELLVRANQAILKARAIGIDDPVVHNISSRVYWYLGEYDNAVTEARRSLELDPNFAEAINWYAALLNWQGDHEGALRLLQQSLRLNPKDQSLTHLFMGFAYSDLGEFDQAIHFLKEFQRARPKALHVYHHIAACYVAVGNMEQARDYIRKERELIPTLSIQGIKSRPSVGRSPKTQDAFFARLALAGVP